MDITGEFVKVYQFAVRQGLTPAESFDAISEELSALYKEQGWAALRTVMKDLIDACAGTIEEAEVFVDGFFDITAGGGDSFTDEDAWFFEDVVRKYPNSLKFLDALAGVYAALCNGHNNAYFAKLAQLSTEHPDMSSVALYYASSLVNLVWDTYEGTVSTQDYTEAVRRVKGLYDAHPTEEFAEKYVEALKNLAGMQDTEDNAAPLIAIIEALLAQWPNKYISRDYLSALNRLTWLQDERGCAATIEKMESMWDGYPYALDMLAMDIAYALANYSLCLDGSDKEIVLQQIKGLAQWWKPAARMASELGQGTYAYAHKPKKAA